MVRAGRRMDVWWYSPGRTPPKQRIIPLSGKSGLGWEDRMVRDKLNRNLLAKPEVLKALGLKKPMEYSSIGWLLKEPRKPMKGDSRRLVQALKEIAKARKIILARKKKAAELSDARASRKKRGK
ncbi:Uncharacterised protein [uncultured archaeon]|nr:Uncharacterised protein [uncultured archaeon]